MSEMSVCWQRRVWKLWLASWLVVGGAIASKTNCAVAQITPDTTLPNNSRVTTQHNIRTIEGGTQAGSNLFHSFQEFSVPTGGTAFFNNAVDIQNIISRITGKSISNIDGLIRANGTANLFLINPNGIIFGPNASLNIGGSFVATTASSLKFADGSQFSATAPQTTPLLTISVPIGLQYGGNAGSILNQSQATNSSGVTGLKVSSGNTLALVGGDVKLDGGSLQAPGGRVELGGLSGAGTVGLNISDRNFSLNFPANAAIASVLLTNSADVNVASSGGGSIAVNARNIDVLGGSSLRAGISLNSQADGAQAGDITLKATGTLNIENSSFYNAVFGAGNGGNLLIDTGKLIVRDGIVTTGTVSQGRAGDLIVKAKDSVELTSSNTSNGTLSAKIPVNIFGVSDFPVRLPIGLFSASFDAQNILILPPILNLGISLPTAGGNAGNLTIETGRLIVRDGAVISAGTTTAGNAGNLTTQGRLVGTTELGKGGNITLNIADLLLMRHNSQISTTAGMALAGGDGGNITINAPNGFIVAVKSENSDITANAFSGSGGRVTINATGIFGIAPLSRQDLERLRPNDLDPCQLPTNDITAFSQTSPNLSGTVTVNTPDIDLSRAFVNLPTVPVDTKVAQGCTTGSSQAQSEFIITGRGGLPPNPGEALSTDAVQVDLVTLNPEVNQRSTTAVSTNPTNPIPPPIVEATGWVIDADGNVTLTANPPTVTPHSSWQKTADCRAFNQQQGR